MAEAPNSASSSGEPKMAEEAPNKHHYFGDEPNWIEKSEKYYKKITEVKSSDLSGKYVFNDIKKPGDKVLQVVHSRILIAPGALLAEKNIHDVEMEIIMPAVKKLTKSWKSVPGIIKVINQGKDEAKVSELMKRLEDFWHDVWDDLIKLNETLSEHDNLRSELALWKTKKTKIDTIEVDASKINLICLEEYLRINKHNKVNLGNAKVVLEEDVYKALKTKVSYNLNKIKKGGEKDFESRLIKAIEIWLTKHAATRKAYYDDDAKRAKTLLVEFRKKYASYSDEFSRANLARMLDGLLLPPFH